MAVVATVLLTACDPPFPSDDDFYRPPSQLPPGEPGDVISSRSSRFTLNPINKAPVPNVSAQQVVYRSTDALGQPMAVTGTVLVPTTPWARRGRPAARVLRRGHPGSRRRLRARRTR